MEADPSRRLDMIQEALLPPEPQLLDTCVLQNLDWIDRQLLLHKTITWDDEAETKLALQYGSDLARDLIDLGILYKNFEYDGGYPWLICKAAIDEAALFRGTKGESLRQLIKFLSEHQDDWAIDSYGSVAPGLLNNIHKPSQLILRSLGVSSPEEMWSSNGPLNFLPDKGDRIIVTHALFANVPIILTTDLRTLWLHRERITNMGIQILRPSELLQLYEVYWSEIENEYHRRKI